MQLQSTWGTIEASHICVTPIFRPTTDRKETERKITLYPVIHNRSVQSRFSGVTEGLARDRHNYVGLHWKCV